MKIAIIGTAGRKPELMYSQLWPKMKTHCANLIRTLSISQGSPLEIVSGGAAWADHLALYISSSFSLPLTLHLPAAFDEDNCCFTASKAGATSNYYHRLFSKQCSINSLRGLSQALEICNFTVSKGFYERNLLVGQVDTLIAYTFGTFSSSSVVYKTAEDSGLADGGTAHTWNNSQALYRWHINLYDL